MTLADVARELAAMNASMSTRLDSIERTVEDIKAKVFVGNGKESLMTRVHNLETQCGFGRWILPHLIAGAALIVAGVSLWKGLAS